jgi:hypothetical protein
MTDNREPQQQATIRRAPKMSMFLVLGGGVGALVTFILTALFPVDEQVGFGPLLGYFMLYGVPAGVALGAIVALILDRRSRKHTTQVAVERESVLQPEVQPELEPEPELELEQAPDADDSSPER